MDRTPLQGIRPLVARAARPRRRRAPPADPGRPPRVLPGLPPLVTASVLLHAMVAGLLLLAGALHWVGLPEPARNPAIVEVMLNDPGSGGAPRVSGQGRTADAPATDAKPATAQARPQATPMPPLPPLPRTAHGSIAPPQPDTAPADRAEAEHTVKAPPPAVRLSDSGDSGETDEIDGPRVAPPSPDGAFRNIPPRYPRAAVRRQEEGRVEMLLHISETGTVVAAEIARSSGYVALDTAAQEAALGWRFRPASENGFPVPSTLPYAVTFELSSQEGTGRP